MSCFLSFDLIGRSGSQTFFFFGGREATTGNTSAVGRLFQYPFILGHKNRGSKVLFHELTWLYKVVRTFYMYFFRFRFLFAIVTGLITEVFRRNSTEFQARS